MSRTTELDSLKRFGNFLNQSIRPWLSRFNGASQDDDAKVSDASSFVLNGIEEGIKTSKNLKVGETVALQFRRRKDFIVYSEDADPITHFDVQVVSPLAAKLRLKTALGFVNMEFKRDQNGKVATSIATGGQNVSGDEKNRALYIAGTDIFFSQAAHLMGPGWRLYIAS